MRVYKRGPYNVRPIRLFERTIVMESGCWEWQGARNRNYGFVNRRGTVLQAHRLAWEFVNGPIPDGLMVLHQCDNPPCINPDHLTVGTAADNSADMMARGRCPDRRGELHPSCRITDDDIRRIRELSDEGYNRKKLGQLFGVTPQHISNIVLRRVRTCV